MDGISSRIQKITHQLQGIRGNVIKDLNMLGSNSGTSSAHHQSTALDPHRRTSSLLQDKVYGRDEEKNSILNRMTAAKSDSVTILPIVGIGGTGKTTLAQFVYNHPNVQNQFDHSIWIWVSNSFDEMRLTREMLDIVPREKHKGLCSLDKLQQVLKTHIESKRVLLILDDIWDDKNNERLDLILAPFKSNNANGNVILLTTRDLSVAKRIGTTEPVVLRELGEHDFWSLFKARAFYDENYEGNLTQIGLKIADKLEGNPLAAVTAGELLRVDLTVDHWTKILMDEEGKLLGRSGVIMAALKLSYDKLPYHLHQCFSYCSIFPDKHQFLAEQLVRIWISQGFVKQRHPVKRLEEIGMDYFVDLVNLGYFEQVRRKNAYVVCGLMHVFARMVSRTDCAIIDGLKCNDILPTVQHLSIVYSRYHFTENLLNIVASVVTKLRSLVLIVQYESSFQLFQDILRKAHNLRMLQMSATLADVCSLVNPTHVRYLQVVSFKDVVSVQGLSKFFHLQVLDLGSAYGPNVPDGMNNLVSLRHLVAASIAIIGKFTSLQTLKTFSIQDSNGFHFIELQSMNDLVQLGISQLQNVKTREEACGAGLRYKRHLEKLHLSWNMPVHEYNSDDSNECENVTSYEYDLDTRIETEECLQTEVLEGLEPHNNLKHLQITGYNGATSPSWLTRNISLSYLQTLYLNGCGEWRILPSLRGLPFLAKLNLRNMPKLEEVSVPSLEELVLVKMPKLERCSCLSLRELNSCLRVLKIINCIALKVFDLFGNGHKLNIEQKSWLPRIWELIIHNCPLLLVPHPLPSSSIISRISMIGALKFPIMNLRSCGSLAIGEDTEAYVHSEDDEYGSDEDSFEELSDELLALDGKILAFHNLRFLTELIIDYCKSLTSISLKGLSQLVSLETLRIKNCPGLSGFDVPPEHNHEDLTVANYNTLPSLKYLKIWSCGIAWDWLSMILQHAPALTALDLWNCPKLESLRLNYCAALEKLRVSMCRSLGTLDVLQTRSLRNMEVRDVPNSKSLQLHPCRALESVVVIGAADCKQSLRELVVNNNKDLKSLQLHSCTTLEELDIRGCTSLSTLEGFQSFGSLRRLCIRDCCGLHSCLEGLPVQDYELCPRLELLNIRDFSFLTTSFCKQLTSLQRLVICGLVEETTAEGLTDEQERGLLLLGSLTQLHFTSYKDLKYLPAGLHRLHSLQVLKISDCPSISGLPLLPPSLEELRIACCSKKLVDQSKSLASSKLKVKIGWEYVN